MSIRLKVTLSDEHHRLLQRLSRQQEVSMSAILADLFATAAPVLERVADSVDAIERAQGDVKVRLRQSLEEFEQAMHPFIAACGDRMEDVDQQLGLSLDGAAADGRSPAAEGPPPSNTGVRPPKNAPKRCKSHAL